MFLILFQKHPQLLAQRVGKIVRKLAQPFSLPLLSRNLMRRKGLTFRRSRPPTAAAELRALAPLKNRFIQAHAFSNGIQFLRRCAVLGLSFLWASPAGFASFFTLFGLQPLRSKRKQLSFCKRCAASVALCFSAVRARRQIQVTRFGFWF